MAAWVGPRGVPEPPIMEDLEIRTNETEIDCQNIKNEIMEIMRGSRDKKRLDRVALDFTTDFDIEWVFHNDNRKPDTVISNDIVRKNVA